MSTQRPPVLIAEIFEALEGYGPEALRLLLSAFKSGENDRLAALLQVLSDKTEAADAVAIRDREATASKTKLTAETCAAGLEILRVYLTLATEVNLPMRSPHADQGRFGCGIGRTYVRFILHPSGALELSIHPFSGRGESSFTAQQTMEDDQYVFTDVQLEEAVQCIRELTPSVSNSKNA